jgi:hypothetical protein
MDVQKGDTVSEIHLFPFHQPKRGNEKCPEMQKARVILAKNEP